MAEQSERCGNCKFFLELNVNGKGVCRYYPPQASDDKNETPVKNDMNGRRWPLCWVSEWCGKWVKKIGG